MKKTIEYGEKAKETVIEAATDPITISVLTGAALGVARNAADFAIRIGGRSSNVVSIYYKNVKSSLGNSKWFARVDMPHGNVPYPHINVNKAITGIKDPHIPISATTAKAAGLAGQALEVVNRMSSHLEVLAYACNLYLLGKNVIVDFNNKTTRNTLKAIATMVTNLLAGKGGYALGAAGGTLAFPGVGTRIGGLAGGLAGGAGGVYVMDPLIESALDDLKLDILEVECTDCKKVFECRKYEIGDVKKCEECRNPDDIPRIPGLKEMVMPVLLKLKSKL